METTLQTILRMGMNSNMNENRLPLRGKSEKAASGIWTVFKKTGKAICLGGVVVALSFVTACGNAETGIGISGNGGQNVCRSVLLGRPCTMQRFYDKTWTTFFCHGIFQHGNNAARQAGFSH